MSSLRGKGKGKAAAPSRSRGGAAARPAGGRGVFVQKPKSDVYVALLGVALGSLLIGSLFLILHLSKYEFNLKATANTPALSAIA